MNQLKVMSFNLRFETEKDGINAFSKRYGRVINVINAEQPDLIGFQEVTPFMRDILRAHLPDYTLQGCGRAADCSGESMLIGYRTNETELISLENFWLSKTPSIPGSRYGGDQSKCPRMAISALLMLKQHKRIVRIVNTHLDHQGANARYLGSVQLMQHLSHHNEPFFLTGDFNALPSAPEIRIFTETPLSRPIYDCTHSLKGTWHGYSTTKEAVKIDYIFSNIPCQNAYIVPDEPINGQFYSDHNAVCALFDPTDL